MREVAGAPGADFTLDIVCDHRSEPDCVAPERLVAVLYHVPARPDSIGFLRWRAARVIGVDGAVQEDPQRTYFSELDRLTRDMADEEREAVLRSPARRDALLQRGEGRVMGGESWNFRCADCRLTVPVRGEKMTPVLDTLRKSAVSRLLLRQLPPILQA